MPRKRAGDVVSKTAAKKSATSAIMDVAEQFSAFRPASEVLRVVRAVPTRFVQFDWATRVGGLPIDRFGLVHGKSAGGKTQLCIGLLGSFLDVGHFARLIDAERTTPFTWPRKYLGPVAESTRFGALKPATYEACQQAVRHDLHTLRRVRGEKLVHEDTSALYVLDSITQLTPQGFFEQVAAAAKGKEQKDRYGKAKRMSYDGASGMGAMIQANYNAAWLKELTQLLDDCGAGFLAITRQTEHVETSGWNKGEVTVKIRGGVALIYESSYMMDVDTEGPVYDRPYEAGGENKDREVWGERFRVTFEKTKVSGKKERKTECHFHTSNGNHFPEGFDRPRDVLELAEEFEVVRSGGGGWYQRGKVRLGQGKNKVLEKLWGEPDLLGSIEAEVRAHPRFREPAEAEAAT